MSKVKRWKLVLVLVLSAVGPMAVGQQSNFDFPTWQAEEAGMSAWWRQVIQAFETRNPGVRVELSGATPSSNHAQQMTIRMAAGDPPDVLHLPAARAREFAREGWLAPVEACLSGTGILDAWTPLQSYLAFDGHDYGLLLLGYTFTLFYNARLLEEAGVGVPHTTEEFVAAITAVSDHFGGDAFGYAFPTLDAQTFYTEITPWIVAAGGHWSKDGQVTVDTPEVRQGLTWVREIFDAGAAPQGLNIAQRNQLFYEGKVAMLLTGPWQYAGIRANAAEHVVAALGVAGQPFARASGGASNSIHIPAGLSDAEFALACDFIQTLASPELQRAYAETAQLPAPRAGSLSPELVAQYPHLEGFTAGVDAAVNFMPPGFEDVFSEFSRVVADEVNRMLVFQDLTIDQVIANIEAGVSRLGR